MRPIKPAAPARPRYPRLTTGWRLLVGVAPLALLPSLALGDASVPNTGDKPGNRDGKPNTPQPQPPRPQPDPPMGGAPPMPYPPDPPTVPDPPPKKDKDKKKKLGALLHPHGPDEPCFPLDRFFRVKV